MKKRDKVNFISLSDLQPSFLIKVKKRVILDILARLQEAYKDPPATAFLLG